MRRQRRDGQDWTLPEPAAASYPEELMDSAKAFSHTAVIVLGRVGGEGADLPHDMNEVAKAAYNASRGGEPCLVSAATRRLALSPGAGQHQNQHGIQLQPAQQHIQAQHNLRQG